MPNKVIGIYNELDEDEKLIKETPHLVEIREERGLKFIGIKVSNETPDTSFARIYLTNKRLLFLTFFVGKISELKSGKGDIAGISADWSEIPLSQINKVETAKLGFFSLLFGTDKKDLGELNIYYTGGSKLTMILSQRDMWRALLEENCPNLTHKVVGKALGAITVELTKDTRITCPTCGTKYDKNFVKLLACNNCGREVCREARVKTGFLKSEWKRTECFNNKKFMCKACAAKSKRKK